jgi:hypothetical protein
MGVCKDKIMAKLTGKYAEMAMDSYGAQTKMWKWSWTIMENKFSFFSASGGRGNKKTKTKTHTQVMCFQTDT